MVRAVGEIDLASVPELEQPLLELVDSGFGQIVLDLQDVTFMDSSGVRVYPLPSPLDDRVANSIHANAPVVVGGGVSALARGRMVVPTAL